MHGSTLRLTRSVHVTPHVRRRLCISFLTPVLGSGFRCGRERIAFSLGDLLCRTCLCSYCLRQCIFLMCSEYGYGLYSANNISIIHSLTLLVNSVIACFAGLLFKAQLVSQLQQGFLFYPRYIRARYAQPPGSLHLRQGGFRQAVAQAYYLFFTFV